MVEPEDYRPSFREDGYHPSFDDELLDAELLGAESGGGKWRRNVETATHMRRLQNLMLIGRSQESHAKRYSRLAFQIEYLDQSVALLHKEGRLKRLRGIGPGIAAMVGEFLRTGTTAPYERWREVVPEILLDLLGIPGVGVATVRILAIVFGIGSLPDLRRALSEGKLDGVHEIGPKTLESMRQYVELQAG
jgi:DNA polymerase (family X)